MQTLVFNLTDNARVLEPVMPLLYPLLRQGKLALIERPPSGTLKSACSTALEAARARLSFDREPSQWHALILLNLREIRTSSRSDTRLGNQLDIIALYLLDPFRETDHGPQTVTLLVLDEIQREDTHAPRNLLGKVFWEIDRTGLLPSPTELTSIFEGNSKMLGRFFSKDDFNDLPWDIPPSLYDQDTKKQMQEACKKLEECLKNKLDEKIALIQTDNTDDDVSRYLKLYEKIAQDFNSTISSLEASSLHGFIPADAAAKIVRDHFSLDHALSRINCSCLVLDTCNGNRQWQLKLAMILLLLAEFPDVLRQRPRLLQYATISCDQQIMSACFQDLLKHWNNDFLCLSRRYAMDEPATLPLIPTDALIKAPTLSDDPMEGDNAGLGLELTSSGWKAWRDTTEKNMRGLRGEAEGQLDALAKAYLDSLTDPATRRSEIIDSLEEDREKRKAHVQDALAALQETEPYPARPDDWLEKIRTFEKNVREYLLTRPSFSQQVLLIAVVFIVLVLPYIVSLPFLPLIETGTTCAAFLGIGCVIAMTLACADTRRASRLRDEAKMVYTNFTNEILTMYESSLNFIQASHQVMAARGNLALVENALQDAGEKRRRISHVAQQCQRGLRALQDVPGLKLDVTGQNFSQAHPPAAVQCERKNLSCEQPFTDDPAFIPEGWSTSPSSIIIEVDSAQIPLQSLQTPGLLRVFLTSNSIFQ